MNAPISMRELAAHVNAAIKALGLVRNESARQLRVGQEMIFQPESEERRPSQARPRARQVRAASRSGNSR